jgi:hypothetical protein
MCRVYVHLNGIIRAFDYHTIILIFILYLRVISFLGIRMYVMRKKLILARVTKERTPNRNEMRYTPGWRRLGMLLKRFRHGSLDLLCVHTEAYYVGGVAVRRGLLARKKASFFFHLLYCHLPTVCDDNIDPAYNIIYIRVNIICLWHIQTLLWFSFLSSKHWTSPHIFQILRQKRNAFWLALAT